MARLSLVLTKCGPKRTSGELLTVVMSRASWVCRKLKGSAQSKSRATVAQIAKKVNASSDWKVSKYYHLHLVKHLWDVQDKHFQARAHLQGSSGFLSLMAWCCGRRS